MSTVTTNLPGNTIPSSPISEDIGGTGVSNALGHTLTINNGAVTINAATGGSVISLPASGSIPAGPTTTVAGHVATFSNTTGTLQDSSVALSSLQLAANIKFGTISYGGGNATFTLNVPGLTTSSIILVGYQSYSNPSTITSCNAGNGTVTIITTANPGNSVFYYVAAIAPQ